MQNRWIPKASESIPSPTILSLTKLLAHNSENVPFELLERFNFVSVAFLPQVCYAKELKEGFVEYTEQVVKLMVPLLKFYFHDDILHETKMTRLMVNPCWYLEVYNAFRLFEMHNFTPDLHWFTFKNLNWMCIYSFIMDNRKYQPIKGTISKEWREHLLLNKFTLALLVLFINAV